MERKRIYAVVGAVTGSGACLTTGCLQLTAVTSHRVTCWSIDLFRTNGSFLKYVVTASSNYHSETNGNVL